MDGWKGKLVKVELSTGKYYKGLVEEETEEHISILDKFRQWIHINKQFIVFIQEVKE